MGFLGFFESTPPPPMETERAVEKTENNEKVRAAVEEYQKLQDQIRFGGSTSEDKPLVEQAEERVREELKAAGVILAFVQMSNVAEDRDYSLPLFVKEYLMQDTEPEQSPSIDDQEAA